MAIYLSTHSLPALSTPTSKITTSLHPQPTSSPLPAPTTHLTSPPYTHIQTSRAEFVGVQQTHLASMNPNEVMGETNLIKRSRTMGGVR